MKTILAVFLLLSAGLVSAKEPAPGFGLGFMAGDTIGGTGKLWLDDYSAIDAAMGLDTDESNFVFYADYLYHGWKAFPQPRSGRLGAYVGGGPRIETITKTTSSGKEDDVEFGVRAVAGVTYLLNDAPFEFFTELGPFMRMHPTGGVYAVGGCGVRYYFKGWN